MSQEQMSFGIQLTLHTDFATAEAKVREALKFGGFGVVTEIDVQATVKEKLNEEFRAFKILGACHPRIAHQALSIDPMIGMLLPCNVTLSEEGENNILATFVNPLMMVGLMQNPTLQPLADEAYAGFSKAIESLKE
jgi:uncharacterized protein (DUF302 family)